MKGYEKLSKESFFFLSFRKISERLEIFLKPFSLSKAFFFQKFSRVVNLGPDCLGETNRNEFFIRKNI